MKLLMTVSSFVIYHAPTVVAPMPTVSTPMDILTALRAAITATLWALDNLPLVRKWR
jgi:hypothetical protein